MVDMNKEDVKELFRIARGSIEETLFNRIFEIDEKVKEKFSEKKGVFVTIKIHPTNELRGCIGFPHPLYPLWEGVYFAAKEAAFNDPRFPPLTESEYRKTILEISILTKPEKIIVENPREYLEKIEIGKDGLIVRYGEFSGLLLPQVPIEEGWDAEKFLDFTCWKAGLPFKAWLSPDVEVYKFQSEVWSEKQPFGEIERIL